MEISRDSAVIAIIVLSATYVLVFTPISLHFARKLWILNANNIPFIIKRHAKIVICNVILFNIYPTIIRPIIDLTLIHTPSHKNSIIENTTQKIFLQFVQFPVVFMCVRLWLLYWDYTSELQTLTFKWKTQITEQHVTPWTVRYRWMGNPKIVIIIGCIFSTILIAIILTLGYKYEQYTQPSAVLYVIFIVIMMIKIHKCRDEFYIRNEFLVMMLWLIGCGIIYVAIIIQIVPRRTNIRIVVMNMFTSLAAYVLCLISTYWVIRQYYKQKAELQLELTHTLSQNDNSDNNKLSLTQILCKPQTFDLFADHLVKEFSLENLTFIFEVMQIKHEAIKNKLVTENDLGVVISMTNERLSKVKRKHNRMQNIKELKQSIQHVIEQYIYREADFCINISSDNRMAVLNTFNALENEEIHDNIADLVDRNLHAYTGTNTVKQVDKELTLKYIQVFDDAVNAIWALMKLDPLIRFYRSKEYQIMLNDSKMVKQ